MATVSELSAPYENHLRAVLPAGDEVCPVCHTFLTGGYALCYQCNEARRWLPFTADAVNFVALAVKGEQLARELWVYKNGTTAGAGRIRLGLSAVLWKALAQHENCLARAAGVVEFPIVTMVPSTKGRLSHPLEEMLGTVVGATSGRYRTMLRPRPDDTGEREFDAERFELIGEVDEGAPVLLIDDTYTTGSRVQCAAAALKAVGSGPVGVLCIGRHFSREQTGEIYRHAADRYYKESRALGWSWDRCCLCTP